jgi:hypothetical protein
MGLAVCATTFGLADGLVDGIHLRLAALVAPDQRGAHDVVRRVEQDEAVHLAG